MRELENKYNQLPKKFRKMDSDRIDLLKRFYEEGLFIWGKVGTGKSVLAASFAKTYISEGRQLIWINYTAFIMKLQKAFNNELMEDPYTIAEDTAKFPGILIIDDFGAEKLTDFVRQITYYILNEREQRLLPTIITSNFSLAQIDEMIDVRISSRIAGMCKVVELTGDDKRIKSEPYKIPKIERKEPEQLEKRTEETQKMVDDLKAMLKQ